MIEAFSEDNFFQWFKIDVIPSAVPTQNLNVLNKYNFKLSKEIKNYFYWDDDGPTPEQIEFMIDNPPIASFTATKQELPWPNYFYPHYMITSTETNQIINRIKPIKISEEKPFLADALLGQHKNHRWVIVNRLIESGLIDRCLVNLMDGQFCKKEDIADMEKIFPQWGPPRNITSPALDMYDDDCATRIRKSGLFNSTELIEEYNNHWLLDAIPSRIYDASWVSIVGETLSGGNFFRPTEKISKPILAGRVFFVAGTKNYLRELRNLGFETFDDIIDESYDGIDDYIKRTDAVMRSFIDFSKGNVLAAYQKVLPKLEYNQRFMSKHSRHKDNIKNLLEGFILRINPPNR